jgi:hypothetical protein
VGLRPPFSSKCFNLNTRKSSFRGTQAPVQFEVLELEHTEILISWDSGPRSVKVLQHEHMRTQALSAARKQVIFPIHEFSFQFPKCIHQTSLLGTCCPYVHRYQLSGSYIRFEVRIACIAKNVILWVVTTCSVVGGWRCFGGICCLNLQDYECRLRNSLDYMDNLTRKVFMGPERGAEGEKPGDSLSSASL